MAGKMTTPFLHLIISTEKEKNAQCWVLPSVAITFKFYEKITHFIHAVMIHLL